MADIPLISIKGTHFDFGKHMGVNFKDRIHRWLEQNFQQQNSDFCQTTDGKVFVEEYVETCEKYFPHYMEELRGLAEGADVPLEKLFQVNLELEISLKAATLREKDSGVAGKGCTDVVINDTGTILWGHNEDLYPGTRENAFMVCANIDEFHTTDDRVFPAENFVSYTIPGTLPGCCFGFNSSGIAYSVNTVFPEKMPKYQGCKLSEVFVMRSLLSARNFDQFLSLVKGQAGEGLLIGFNCTVGTTHGRKIWSVEAGPDPLDGKTKTSIVEVKPFGSGSFHEGTFPHWNKFEHLGIACQTGISSQHRKKVYESKPCPKNGAELLAYLGDTSDPEWSVYRKPNEGKDKAETSATVLFNLAKQKASIWTANPAHTKPDMVLPFSLLSCT